MTRSTGPPYAAASASLLPGSTTWSCTEVKRSSGIVSVPYSRDSGTRPSTWNEWSAASGVPGYAVSCVDGSAMSLPMPSITSWPASTIPFSMSSTSAGCGRVAGFTHTSPRTSGCRVPAHSVREPPIESPRTTMRDARAARRWYAASTSAVQSAQRVGTMSSITVP